MRVIHIINDGEIMNEFKLSKSIALMNGTEVDVLNLDWDSITCADLKTANRISKMITDNAAVGNVDNSTMSPRLDSNLRIAIAWIAAIKGTKGLTVNDVLNISMVDALCLSEECLSSYLFR